MKSVSTALILGASLSFGVAATFQVSSLSDSGGSGTFRLALVDAIGTPGPDTIVIATNLQGTLTLASALPTIDDSVDIIGPGAARVAIARGMAAGDIRIFDILNAVVAIRGLTISNGQLSAQAEFGAGIRNLGGHLTLEHCAVLNNTVLNNTMTVAGNQGGGLFSGNGATNILVATTIAGNRVNGGNSPVPLKNFGLGGGIFQDSGILRMTNCTVSGNVCDSSMVMNTLARGAGIELISVDAVLANCTIASNTLLNNGVEAAGVRVGGAASVVARFVNTLIAGNAVNDIYQSTPTPPIVSLGNNFFGTTNAAPQLVAQPTDRFGSTMAPRNPMIMGLANNDGALTHATSPGSECIDPNSGIPGPLLDQRGFLRDADPDIGAYEFNGTAPVAPTISQQPVDQQVTDSMPAFTLSVAGDGVPAPTFQWFLGPSGNTSNLIAGATSSNLTGTATVATATYWVRLSNLAGSVNSSNAVVTLVGASTAAGTTAGDTTAGDSTAGGTTGTETGAGTTAGGGATTSGSSTGLTTTADGGTTGGSTGTGTGGTATAGSATCSNLPQLAWTLELKRPKDSKDKGIKFKAGKKGLGTVKGLVSDTGLPKKSTDVEVEIAVLTTNQIAAFATNPCDAVIPWASAEKIGKVSKKGSAKFSSSKFAADAGFASGDSLEIWVRASTNLATSSSEILRSPFQIR